VDSEQDPTTDGRGGADRTDATGAILGHSSDGRQDRGQFLNDGPASSDDESSSRRVRIAVGEGHGGSPKKPKKKTKKKKSTKDATADISAGAGKGVSGGKIKKTGRQEYSGVNSLDQSSSVLSDGDQNPANFWWQGNMGAGQGARSTSPSKQRDGPNAATDKSISFSDAEINRLLQELRIQQQQQQPTDKAPARGNQGKHSMNLGSEDDGEEEEE
jgi:hypothetical protein